MAICEKSFEDELQLVQDAHNNERGEGLLRNYLLPLVQSVANKYAEKEAQNQELISEGFNHLTFGIRKYLEHLEQIQVEEKKFYKFSTYFTWFIRQDIVAYLQKTGI